MTRSSRRVTETAKDVPLNTMDFFVLAALMTGERHGYGIVKDIETRTDGKVKIRPGNLYRVIDRLMEEGLVEPGSRKSSEPSSEKRRLYRITSPGREMVTAHVELIVKMASASAELSPATNAT